MSVELKRDLPTFQKLCRAKLSYVLRALQPYWQEVVPEGWTIRVFSAEHCEESMLIHQSRLAKDESSQMRTFFNSAFPLTHDMATLRYQCDLDKMAENGISMVILDDRGRVAVSVSNVDQLADPVIYKAIPNANQQLIMDRRSEILRAASNLDPMIRELDENLKSERDRIGVVLNLNLIVSRKDAAGTGIFVAVHVMLEWLHLLLGFEQVTWETIHPATYNALSFRFQKTNDNVFRHSGFIDLLHYTFEDGTPLMDTLIGNESALELARDMRQYRTVDAGCFDATIMALRSGLEHPSCYRWIQVDQMPEPHTILHGFYKFLDFYQNALVLPEAGVSQVRCFKKTQSLKSKL